MEQDWISIKDRLPEIGVRVKVKIGTMSMSGTTYHESIGHVINQHGRFNVGFDWSKVAYWKPLEESENK